MKTLGRRLRDRRVARRLSQFDVAESLGVSRSTVAQMELGNRSVTASDLEKLAALYACSAATLLRQDPGGEPVLSELCAAEPALARDPSMLEGIERAVRLASYLVELEDLMGVPQMSNAPIRHPDRAVRSPWEAMYQGYRTAGEERRRLDLGGAPIRDLDEELTRQRIRSTRVDLPPGVNALVLQAPSIGPMIMVNAQAKSEHWRFNLAHGYAHVLFDADHPWTLCKADDQESLTETRANAFATRLLLPESGLLRFLESLGKETLARGRNVTHGLWYENMSQDGGTDLRIPGRAREGAQTLTMTDIVQISHYFGVSPAMVLSTLRNLRLVDEGGLESLSQELREGLADRLRELLGLRRNDVEMATGAFVQRLLALVFEAARERRMEEGPLLEIVAALEGAGSEAAGLVQTLLEGARFSKN